MTTNEIESSQYRVLELVTHFSSQVLQLCVYDLISERLKDSLQLEIPVVEGFYILITNLKLTQTKLEVVKIESSKPVTLPETKF